MIMEYLPGGNLITLLERYELNEEAARFYCAEIALAVEAIHSMGYVHRFEEEKPYFLTNFVGIYVPFFFFK